MDDWRHARGCRSPPSFFSVGLARSRLLAAAISSVAGAGSLGLLPCKRAVRKLCPSRAPLASSWGGARRWGEAARPAEDRSMGWERAMRRPCRAIGQEPAESLPETLLGLSLASRARQRKRHPGASPSRIRALASHAPRSNRRKPLAKDPLATARIQHLQHDPRPLAPWHVQRDGRRCDQCCVRRFGALPPPRGLRPRTPQKRACGPSLRADPAVAEPRQRPRPCNVAAINCAIDSLLRSCLRRPATTVAACAIGSPLRILHPPTAETIRCIDFEHVPGRTRKNRARATARARDSRLANCFFHSSSICGPKITSRSNAPTPTRCPPTLARVQPRPHELGRIPKRLPQEPHVRDIPAHNAHVFRADAHDEARKLPHLQLRLPEELADANYKQLCTRRLRTVARPHRWRTTSSTSLRPPRQRCRTLRVAD